MRVRFGRWDEILSDPEPSEGRFHARAMWHYARGRAFAARKDVTRAWREADVEVGRPGPGG